MQILVPQHWTLEVQGSSGVVEGDLYKVEALGCCASVATQKFQVNSETLAENDWDINSMEFIYPKDQSQYSTNTTEYITASKSNAKGVGIAIELSCRCEHEPIKISLTMAEDKVDPALSTWNFKQLVSLKQSL